MRKLAMTNLWLGHLGDARDLRTVLDADIRVLVDLAAEELPVTITRDLVYCRFAIVDGGGNPSWRLRAAIDCVAGFVRDNVPTLLYCSAGVSRTPVIAAAAVALARGTDYVATLEQVITGAAADVSPALLRDVRELTLTLKASASLLPPN